MYALSLPATKDVEGDLEKFLNAIGQDFDDNLDPYIYNILDKALNPHTCIPNAVPFLKANAGNNYFINRSITAVDKATLAFYSKWRTRRGTVWCFTQLFRYAGYNATLDLATLPSDLDTFNLDEVLDMGSELDHDTMAVVPITLDAGAKTVYYTIRLTAISGEVPIPFTDKELHTIFSVIRFNHPIGCRLLAVFVNTYQIYPNKYPLIQNLYISDDCSFQI